MECLINLMILCPRLKSLLIEMRYGHLEPLELYHGTLEELEFFNVRHAPQRISCPQLRKLVIKQSSCTLVSKVECPFLEELQITRGTRFSSLPSILLELKHLQRIQIIKTFMDGDLVLQHSCIKELLMDTCRMSSLVLSMSSLVRVSLIHTYDTRHTRLRLVKVESGQKMWLTYTSFVVSTKKGVIGPVVREEIEGLGTVTLS